MSNMRKAPKISPEQKKALKEVGAKDHIDAHEKFVKHYNEIKLAMGKLGTAINQGTDADVYDAAKAVRNLIAEDKIDAFVRAAW